VSPAGRRGRGSETEVGASADRRDGGSEREAGVSAGRRDCESDGLREPGRARNAQLPLRIEQAAEEVVTPEGTAAAVYRALLRLYPRAFRDVYEHELLDTFDAQRREPRYRGAMGALIFWRDILRDLATSVARLRTRSRSRVALKSNRPNARSLDAMLHDLRYSLRLLARRPGFTAVAILSLTLGIGGTSLIFGLVDALVLRPFALPDPDRLVSIGVSFPKSGDAAEQFFEALSPLEAEDIARARTLTHVQTFDLGNRHVSGGDQPERLFTALVFGDLFPTVGVPPHLGRGFTAEELAPGGRQAAIISHRVWRSLFGGDPAIIGRDIRVNGTPRTIVGVMPPEVLIAGTDLWLPLQATPTQWPRQARGFNVLARIAPGATRQTVKTELDAIAASITAAHVAAHKEYDGWRLIAAPFADVFTRSIQPAAYLLLGAIGFVLLIVCVNIANLQIARASTRQRELAVRLALGASRWRIACQLLIESLLLAGAGCALGVLFARIGLRGSIAFIPGRVLLFDPQIDFNGRVLIVSIAAAVASALLVGVLPAIRTVRADPFDSLKSDSRHATAGVTTHRLRYGLIIAEIALAMILLVGAGLLTRTMLRLSRIEPGLDVHNVLTMRLTLPREKYKEAAVPAFFEQLVARVEALPGVRGAAVASQYPPNHYFRNGVRIERRGGAGGSGSAGASGSASGTGSTSSSGSASGGNAGSSGSVSSGSSASDIGESGAPLPIVDLTVASPGLLRTLGIPLRAGRDFSADDREQSPPVAIVNETFARRFYQHESPIGRRIAWDTIGAPRWMTIIGVAGDTRGQGVLGDITPGVYVPARQNAVWNQLFLLVRTDAEPRALLPSVRREIIAIDRDQPAYNIQTLEEAFAASLFTQRALMTLLAIFSALGLTLAAIGIYAVMSFAVAARTQEIGIRIALGADAHMVKAMVVKQVLWLAGAGITIGLGGALALGRFAQTVLAGTTATDPITLASVATLLASVALLAGYLPARRASRIDPITALHVE
jgi:putative ABC transport system permease protein